MTTPAPVEFKYTLAQLATDTGREPAAIRVVLRKSDLTKPDGGRWGWNTKADYEKAVALFKAEKAPKAAPVKDDAKPAAKGKPAAAPKADAKAPAKAKPAAKPKAAKAA